jgi:hypothetical protein
MNMAVQSRPDDVKFYAMMLNESKEAVLMVDGRNEIWIPRSQIVSMRSIRDYNYELTIPQWLAKKKGII